MTVGIPSAHGVSAFQQALFAIGKAAPAAAVAAPYGKCLQQKFHFRSLGNLAGKENPSLRTNFTSISAFKLNFHTTSLLPIGAYTFTQKPFFSPRNISEKSTASSPLLFSSPVRLLTGAFAQRVVYAQASQSAPPGVSATPLAHDVITLSTTPLDSPAVSQRAARAHEKIDAGDVRGELDALHVSVEEFRKLLPEGAALVFHRHPDISFWRRVKGTLVLCLMLSGWIVGSLTPLFFLWCLLKKHTAYACACVFLFALPHVLVGLRLIDPSRSENANFVQRVFSDFMHAARDYMGKGSSVILDSPEAFLTAGRKPDGTHTTPGTSDGRPPTLLCIHPHGIFTMGIVMLSAVTELKHFTFLIAPFLVYCAPLLRLVTDPVIKTASASRASVDAQMKTGGNLAIVPGGFHEATIHQRGVDRIYLKDRKGFVKYALRHGYSLTPTFVFGEADTYSNIQGGWGLRFLLNHFHIPTVFFWGTPWAPFMPHPAPMMVVVGKPIELPKIENPSRKQVEEWHAKYLQAVEELHAKYKTLYYTQVKREMREHGQEKESHFKVANLEVW